MIAPERLARLLEIVAARQKVSVADLQGETGVSPATLRRDLTALEAAGKIVRVHGAVVHPAFFRGEASFAQKKRENIGAKRAMARAAAELVPPKTSVFVDGGSSCLEVGILLLARRDLTIFTPSIPLAARAHEAAESAKIVVLGGEVRAVSGATTGALALSWLQNLRADCAILGASALDQNGAWTTEIGEAATKSAMIARAKTRILVADTRKWNCNASTRFAAWSDFEWLVCGGDADENLRATTEKLGPRVVWGTEK